MANRVYVAFQVFSARVVNIQHLWQPSYEYLGKKSEKPNYFVTAVIPKTRQNWWEEPQLASSWAAYSELLQRSGMTPQHVTSWPVKDGDMPPEPGKNPSDWAKGHWIIGGSSSNAIKVEMVQGNSVVPLAGRAGVKPGDFVALGLSAAIKQNDPRAIKHFCNTVLFMGPGEEIAVGNSVSGAELFAAAQQQGLQVAGFSGAPGFGGAPGGGFPGGGMPSGGFAPPAGPGGFGGPAGPGFTPQGPAGVPQMGAGPQGGAFPGATAPNGPGFGGPAAFPSNQPQGAPGFGQPGPQFGQPGPSMTTFPSNGPGFGPR